MITIGQTERWDSNQFCVAHEAAAAVPTRSPGSVFGPHPTHDVEGDRESLPEHVHRHGARYTTDELVEEATGEAFSADYFVEYADEKYRSLYDC